MGEYATYICRYIINLIILKITIGDNVTDMEYMYLPKVQLNSIDLQCCMLSNVTNSQTVLYGHFRQKNPINLK